MSTVVEPRRRKEPERIRGHVPIGPIRRVVKEVLAPLERAYEDDPGSWSKSVSAPVAIVAEEIARYSGHSVESVYRLLYRIRYGRELRSRGERKGEHYECRWVRFDTADMILCALDREYEWHSDPELAEAYRDVS